MKAAFSGSINVSIGGQSTSYAFTSSAGTSGNAYSIAVDGEQALIGLEDMAGQSGCDWDYNDRVWAMMVRQTGAETVVSTSTDEWTNGTWMGTVTVTVTADKPGYEGLYHWNYHFANTSINPNPIYDPGVGMFLIRALEPSGITNLTGPTNWTADVGEHQGDPQIVRWTADLEDGPRVLPGQSADFSFTTPVCLIADSTGGAFEQSYADGVEDETKTPGLMIRSVTLWGMPGSAPDPLGAAAGTPHAVTLGNNPKEGGGKRIFPEKNKPGVNSTVYNQVRVMVELSQAPAQNKTVKMYQFDPDDPSAADASGYDIIDSEARKRDNRGRGGNADAAWVGSYSLTVLAGKTTADSMRVVSPQPGDNYRFVASIDADLTLGTDVDIKHVIGPAPLGGVATYYFDGDKAGVYFGGGWGDAVPTANAETVTSPLLTVWRKLHVERDIMGSPPSDEPFTPPGFVRPGSGEEGNQEGDDDVAPDGPDGTVPKPGIAMMQQNYRDAYIELVDDLISYNTNGSIDFVHNMVPGQFASWTPAASAFDVKCLDEKFWCFQLIGGYERETDRDHDGEDNPTPSDGVTKTPLGISFVYMEVARDLWASRPANVQQAIPLDNYFQRVAYHESVHQFGFRHYIDPFAEEGPLSSDNNNTGTDESNRLTPGQLGVIRSKSRPGEV